METGRKGNKGLLPKQFHDPGVSLHHQQDQHSRISYQERIAAALRLTSLHNIVQLTKLENA